MLTHFKQESEMNTFGSTASSSGAAMSGIIEPGIEPGASAETMLVTTDDPSFDEFEEQLGSMIIKETTSTTISDIQKSPVEHMILETSKEPTEVVKLLLQNSNYKKVIYFSG